jgi:hypothetical protein
VHFKFPENSKNRLKIAYFSRSIHDQFAFWLKKTPKWTKKHILRVKIKMHMHSTLNENGPINLQYLRVYVALVALTWHCLKLLIEI